MIRTTFRFLFPMTCLLLTMVSPSCHQALYDPPKSPEETVSTFDLDPRFVAEIFAAEPFIADPVEMIFDDEGRIYAVEMPDYPFKPGPGEGQGKIKELFDDDQDGRIDRATIFAENISEATSIYPWRDGLLVAAAPNISWMRDTDGDGKADTTEIIFSGFFENNSEAQITNLKFMPDNWIYASNNGQGGEVKYLRDSTQPVISMAGADFRFRLDKDKYELVSGPAQFGHAFNDKIHRFVTQNTLHIRQPVIPWKYLHRNPFLDPQNTTFNISDHDLEMFQRTPPPYWRAERTRRRQASYDEQGQGRIEYAEDHFTGASGTTFYGGHTFPADYYGSIFIGDVAGNLVHRDVTVLKENSPVYVASRADSETTKEFLAATDSWFRPANFTVGPDGFLYITDMYRQHIETPLSIPEDLKEDMDFMAGSNLGRIYRIRPKDQPVTTDFEDLSTKTTSELVQLLDHPNRWYRLQAQRLILERKDESSVAMLRQKYNSSERELSRLHALYSIEGLNALDAELIERALRDKSPLLREQAIILSENYPVDKSLLFSMFNDPDPRVVFQACLTLGYLNGEDVENQLLSTFRKNKDEEWFPIAVLTSRAGTSMSFLSKLSDAVGIFETADPREIQFAGNIAKIIGKRQDQQELGEIQKIFLENKIQTSRNYDAILNAFVEGYNATEKKIALTPEFQDYLDKRNKMEN
ncbi:MAG: hypothetical protein KDC80_22495 [Saprospiraceae bacterium]|nr:hypothetical protein [Saprospiraceae bacterium]